MQPREIDGAKLAVIGETRRIKIHTAFCAVGVSLFFERLDHGDLCRHMIARAGKDSFVGFNIQRTDIFEKQVCIFLTKGAHVFERKCKAFAFEAFRHFVVTFVGIRGEVSKIGEVDGLLYRVTVVLKRPPEDIGKDEHRKVADVLAAVDGGAAVVHADFFCVRSRGELLLFISQRIVKVQR